MDGDIVKLHHPAQLLLQDPFVAGQGLFIVCFNVVERPVHKLPRVNLPVDGNREFRKEIPHGGNHVVGKFDTDLFLDLFDGIDDSLVGPAHLGILRLDVGHDVLIGADLLNPDVGATDLLAFLDLDDDLSQFDAVAVQFHLGIPSSHIFAASILAKPYDVPGMIEFRRFFPAVGKGIVDQFLLRKLRPVQVAAEHLRTADEKFTLLPGPDRLHLFIHHHIGAIRGCPSDIAIQVGVRDVAHGGNRRAFGRAVTVDKTVGSFPDTFRQRAGHGLAACAGGLHGSEIELRKEVEHRGRQEHEGHFPLVDELVHLLYILPFLLVDDDERRTIKQGIVEFQDGDIEVDARIVEDDGVVMEMEIVLPLAGEQEVIEVGIIDPDGLGPSGRTRGKDEIGLVVVRRIVCADFPGLFLQDLFDGQRRNALGQLILDRFLGQEEGQRCVFGNEGDPLDRSFRIDGHVGAAKLDDAEDRCLQPLVAAHKDADTDGNTLFPVCPGKEILYARCEAVRKQEQVPVAKTVLPYSDSRLVRLLLHALPDIVPDIEMSIVLVCHREIRICKRSPPAASVPADG